MASFLSPRSPSFGRIGCAFGLITPVLLTFVLILANRRSVLGDAANGRVFKTVATICVRAVAILALTVVALKAFGAA